MLFQLTQVPPKLSSDWPRLGDSTHLEGKGQITKVRFSFLQSQAWRGKEGRGCALV